MPADRSSLPPYQPNSKKHRHRHGERTSHPVYYHPGDKMLHFYRWTSPPGVMKIMSIIIIIMCVAVFACVASTLAWDYDMNNLGLGGGGLVPGFGGGQFGGGQFGGGQFGGGQFGSSIGGGFGGGSGSSFSNFGGGGVQMDPKSAKGFIIAISAITFIAVLVIFVLVVSRQKAATSSKFYLAAIIISAILAFLMLIATIVYLVAVNPTAQTSGSIYYNQIRQVCAQYQNQAQAQGIFLNQYLYHYCVVEPPEAIAIVLGFLVFVALIILLVFAVKTRSSIRRWGRDRILWEEVKVVNDGLHHSVGEWVSQVGGDPEKLLNDRNDQVGAPQGYRDHNKPIYMPGTSDIYAMSSLEDNDIVADSGDNLEENFSKSFPAIMDEDDRLTYKQEFDGDHQEYKRIQVELDNINQRLAFLDGELDRHPEGSSHFLAAMDEYTALKNVKKSSDYQVNKRQSRYLKSKLSHIKKMISDYDHRP
ncbi:occludin b [Nerophis ophidion]|uniref:occludin b n=1 Tax=Nerophis ophidion TaxID=159077 RepID=UPI002AE0876C|nr:occludin b [Nerophis ophidion]